MEQLTCDVAVVGSGPAGACAAREIAAAGLKVLILEKAQLPRYKTCGGGVLGRALMMLGERRLDCAERECYSVEFVLGPGMHYRAEEDVPIISMTMRGSFDQWLTHKAVGAGVELIANCTVTDVTNESSQIRLKTDDNEVFAKFVIAADGANGPIAKRAGWSDHRRLVPALEWEVSVSAEDLARLSGTARFDFHAVPSGYAWVFPKKSHLSIGVLTLKQDSVNLNQCCERYLQYLGIREPISIQRHGFVIPLSPRDRFFARDRVLLTGDAAGFADPVTAEGISYAIQSGQLAGRAIARGFPNARDVAKSYNASVAAEILPELRWARRLAKVLYGMPRVRDALFRKHGQRLTEIMVDIVSGRTSYRELMSQPLNYAKLFS